MSETRALIIGAGAAGISAALWLKDLKVPFDWFERSDRIGGTLHSVYNPVWNYAGLNFDDGADLVAHFEAQLEAAGLSPTFDADVRWIRTSGEVPLVDVGARIGEERVERRYAAVLLGTGTRRRYLGVDGEEENLGRGVARSGNNEKGRFGGKRVMVVGGGDAAFENALILAGVAEHVTLIHRSAQYRARPEFIEEVEARGNIDIRPNTTLLAIDADEGAPFLNAVWLRGEDGNAYRQALDGVLIRIGVDGVLPDIRVDGHPPILTDAHFLVTHHDGRTNHPRVFGMGDCTCPEFRAVAVSVGQGASAARAAAFLMGYYG